MSRPIRKIVLVQPAQPMPSITPSEQIVLPRYGVPLIATILKNAGYDVTLFVEELKPINWEIMYQADLVGFHALSCAVGRARRIVEQLRMKSNVPVVIGGEHATYLPESVLRFCDYVVRQEGDETILDLVDALQTGRDVATVPGVTFHRDGRTIATPDRPPVKNFDTVVDLSTIYGWEKAYKGAPPPYPMMTVQATRGCPFTCQFCPVEVMMGRGYRRRSIESLMVDLKDKLQYSRAVVFVDNLFDGDQKFAKEILNRIIAEDLRPQLTIFCRTSVGKNPEMLKLMRKAGVMRIFVGVESLNQESLDSVTKRQSVADIKLAVDEIRRNGISVLSTLIMGFDTDTVESLEATRRMLHEWGLSQMNVFALWGFYPHEGKRLTPVERIIFKDWDYLNGSYVCHFPLRIRPSQVQRQIMATYDDLFRKDQPPTEYPRWSGRDAVWQDFLREIWRVTRPTMVDYLPFLEETERDYYDEKDHLLVDKLPTRPDLDWVRYHMQ